MFVTSFDVNGALQRDPPLDARSQATLNVIPASARVGTPNPSEIEVIYGNE
jgi:hypothetical protein